MIFIVMADTSQPPLVYLMVHVCNLCGQKVNNLSLNG